MELYNREGQSVDPVPFLVVASIAFAVGYSFGPAYFAALGTSIPQGVALTTLVYAAAVALTFYRFVWTLNPAHRRIVPVADRFRRLVLGVAVCLGAFALLALPLLV